MVDVVIPIYKKNPEADDIIALRQGFRVFKNYPITFVHPTSLDITPYKQFGKADFLAFDDIFFKDIYGYNQLMLSVDFYKSFSKKYILIYQTDAYVFKDELQYWCGRDYDYIGAPWLGSKESIPLEKSIWDTVAYLSKKLINYKKNNKAQKNKSLLYNEVGNGGFSLRKREKFIEVLEKLAEQLKIYTKPENFSPFYAEDVFFSIEPERNDITFSKPDYKEACKFAIENKVEKAFLYNKNELPFGCHRWNKENRAFWKDYIR
ncbi:DUF5672 family protein [Capnocytophaga sp.]|uniref:DUF5672 family protein n=1 Tax=Capnocytophaga sp. TaxID=44737 RepID=UPI0026DD11B1|nr:DUF5672 family protein [Capnocytophaga sp.]MDO5105028.1 DUF5672 family protein [Capnocytophaga sp.]